MRINLNIDVAPIASRSPLTLLIGILVDKDDPIKYQFLVSYGLLVRIFSRQPTVDKTIRAIHQLLIEEGTAPLDSPAQTTIFFLFSPPLRVAGFHLQL